MVAEVGVVVQQQEPGQVEDAGVRVVRLSRAYIFHIFFLGGGGCKNVSSTLHVLVKICRFKKHIIYPFRLILFIVIF